MERKRKIDLTKDKFRTGYTVPEGYFKIFKALLFKKMGFRNSDTQKTELLEDIPSNYFESLGDRMIDGIPFEKKTKVVSISVRNALIATATGIAASILLLFTINFGGSSGKNSIDSLSLETLTTFIEQEQLYFTNEEMALLVEDVEFSEGAFLDIDIQDEHTIEYILEKVNIIDIQH